MANHPVKLRKRHMVVSLGQGKSAAVPVLTRCRWNHDMRSRCCDFGALVQ